MTEMDTDRATRRKTQFVSQSTTDTKLMSANRITEHDVVNLKGDRLGKIEDVMIGEQSGCIAYAVLSLGGGVLGLGDKLHPVPWEALQHEYIGDQCRFRLAMDEDRLQTAPTLDRDRDKWPDTYDQNWLDNLHDFYGVTRRTQ